MSKKGIVMKLASGIRSEALESNKAFMKEEMLRQLFDSTLRMLKSVEGRAGMYTVQLEFREDDVQ